MTKPLSLPRWATDAGCTLEPSSGEKDVGWQAGYKPPARKMNWLFNAIYEWMAWFDDRFFDGVGANDFEVTGVDVASGTDQEGGDLTLSGGSSTGDGGSEIFFKVAKANQGAGATVRTPTQVGTFNEDGGLEVEAVVATATITDGDAIDATGNGTGSGVKGTGGATNGNGVVGAGTGTGRGVQGTGGVTGIGVYGYGGSTSGRGGYFAAAAGNSVGAEAVGHGSGAGIEATGGATGTGVQATGGASGANAIEATGTGTSSGIEATGGTTSGTGVLGVGGSTNGTGVKGEGSGSGSGVKGIADTTGKGVEGYGGSSSGNGGYFQSTIDVALFAQGDPTSPARAPFHIDPQDALPTGPNTVGDICILSTDQKLYVCTAAGSPGTWTAQT